MLAERLYTQDLTFIISVRQTLIYNVYNNAYIYTTYIIIKGKNTVTV